MTLVHKRALLSIEKNLVLVVVLVLESKGLYYIIIISTQFLMCTVFVAKVLAISGTFTGKLQSPALE